MASTKNGGESADISEASEVVADILDFIEEITFEYLRPAIDQEPLPPVICRKEGLTTADKTFASLPFEGEASEVVPDILDFILEIIFVYLRPAIDLELPRVFKSKIPVICRKEDLTITDRSLAPPPRGPEYWSVFESFLRHRSGCSDLRDMLLVITPVEWPNREPNALRVHCYRRDSRTHKGAATVFRSEFQEIECYYGPATLMIVKCNRFIDLVDAVSNTLIKGQIFDMVQEGSKTVRTSWYKGRSLRLTYQGDGTPGKVVDPAESRKFSAIRSLKQPEIPVRMQCRLRSLVKKASSLQIKKSISRIRAGARRREQKGRVQKMISTSRLAKFRSEYTDQALGTPSSELDLLSVCQEEVLICANCLISGEMASICANCLISCSYGRPEPPRLPNRLPPVLPLRFSNAAFCFLEENLRWPRAGEAFIKLRLLVERINARQRPLLKHLICFFWLAEDLRFKIYIRKEVDFPGWTQRQGRRYKLDCYVFDNKRDYIVTIALQDTQLHALARMFPGARQNFRFVDTAFQMTPVPESVYKWLETTFDTFSKRHWFKYLGELALGRVRPPMALLELPEEDEAGG